MEYRSDHPEEMAALSQKLADNEIARQRAAADAEVAELRARGFTPSSEARQYSVESLVRLGKAGVEDVVLHAIKSQVPQSTRTQKTYHRYQSDLVSAVSNLVGLYANGPGNRMSAPDYRRAVEAAAGQVSKASAMCRVTPPVKGIFVDGQTDW